MATRRYPKYDWSGIAMLTQQLSGLFEPSKAKLQSRAQEHEMRKLEAEQAWKVGKERLDLTKEKLIKANEKRDKYMNEILPKWGADVREAAMKDYSVPENSSEIQGVIGAHKIDELQAISNEYYNQLQETNEQLNQMEDMNTHAIMGKGWRDKDMVSEDKDGNVKDYYKEANVDGIPTLSYAEGQNAVKSYIKDNYLAEEDDEDSEEITFGSGKKTETFRVKPEAIAFRAGFEANIGKKTGRGKLEEDLAAYAAKQEKVEESWPDYSDQQVVDRYTDSTDTIERINNKYKGKAKAPIGTYLEIVDGIYTPKDLAKLANFDTDDVNAYIAARNIELTSARHMQKRMISADIDISKQGYVISNEMRSDFNSAVAGTEIDPNNMYNNIIASDPSKEGYNETINMYNEFLRDYDTYPKDKKLLIIKRLNDWLNK